MYAQESTVSHRAANRRSILAMLVAQAVFTANDACVKLATETLPLGEVMVMRNAMALLFIIGFGAFYGGLSIPRAAPLRPFGFRLVCEVLATLFFFWALSRMPIAGVTAIGQFTPLALTAAGAIFLKEHVGWRRWAAAIVGLIGVLLIVQPGTSAFTWAAVIAIIANLFGIGRDLATRMIGPAVHRLTLTFASVCAVLLLGLGLCLFETWQAPDVREIALLAAAGVLLSIGYTTLIISLQSGALAVATPFRYSVILWALAAGYLIWGELPDAVSLIGIAILCAAGLYTIHREQIHRGSGQ